MKHLTIKLNKKHTVDIMINNGLIKSLHLLLNTFSDDTEFIIITEKKLNLQELKGFGYNIF